jgi:hypothetical protein
MCFWRTDPLPPGQADTRPTGCKAGSDRNGNKEALFRENSNQSPSGETAEVSREPLLGQSFLSKFGAVTLDYKRLVLVLSR